MGRGCRAETQLGRAPCRVRDPAVSQLVPRALRRTGRLGAKATRGTCAGQGSPRPRTPLPASASRQEAARDICGAGVCPFSPRRLPVPRGHPSLWQTEGPASDSRGGVRRAREGGCGADRPGRLPASQMSRRLLLPDHEQPDGGVAAYLSAVPKPPKV